MKWGHNLGEISLENIWYFPKEFPAIRRTVMIENNGCFRMNNELNNVERLSHIVVRWQNNVTECIWKAFSVRRRQKGFIQNRHLASRFFWSKPVIVHSRRKRGQEKGCEVVTFSMRPFQFLAFHCNRTFCRETLDSTLNKMHYETCLGINIFMHSDWL